MSLACARTARRTISSRTMTAPCSRTSLMPGRLPEPGHERAMQREGRIAAGLELATSVPRADGFDGDGSRRFVHGERRSPFLHREEQAAVLRLLDASVGVWLRSERERLFDSRTQLEREALRGEPR